VARSRRRKRSPTRTGAPVLDPTLWGGTGNGPSRKARHRASSLPDSTIIRNSNKRSGSDISKDEAGAASITSHTMHRSLRIPGLRQGKDSPSRPCYTPRFEKLAVPEGDQSGGSTAEDRTPSPQLDRDDAQKIDHRACQHPFTMPMLRHACRQRLAP